VSISNLKSILSIIVCAVAVVSCGGSGGGDSQAVVTSQTAGDQASDVPVPDIDNFGVFFSNDFINDNTDDFLNLISSNIGISVEPFNAIPNLFNNAEIPVIYTECGTENAFYSPSDRRIVLCDELTA